jgi:hypothetical protein
MTDRRFGSLHWRLTPKAAVILAAVVAFLIFLSTLQIDINGSPAPYATDVGEIQNALPRWGTIHFTGYPLYTAIGSTFVTVLRPLGIPPAAGASLYSAVWGAISIGLLAALILAFDVPPIAAVVASLLFALSTSMWVDASLAELHTMTMALTFATLLAAVRFGRSGQKSDLYWLAFLAGQGIAHQRAFAFLGLALLVLVVHQWRIIWRKLPQVTGLALLGPLTYLYLPLRAWLGEEWLFSSPGTWDGFWTLVLDTKANRIVTPPGSMAELWLRIRSLFALLTDDWPWPLWSLGLLGLFLPGKRRTVPERLALFLSWLPYLLVSLIIWEGRVSDALLAVKLPVIAMAAVGLALIGRALWQRAPLWGKGSIVVGLAMAAFLYVSHRPAVTTITRDPGAQEVIGLVERVPPAADGRPLTLMALWGNDYWQLAYAQTYKGKFPHVDLVIHDADFATILAQGNHLLTMSHTFYVRPLSWWDGLLGPVHLQAVAPGVVEIMPEPRLAPKDDDDYLLDLGNGVVVRRAELRWETADTLILMVEWQARQELLPNYSVAVHLVSQNPPTDPRHVLAQADREHPVAGWYPTSRWLAGEVVTDYYLLTVPPQAEAAPQAVRLGMYQLADDGQFQNSDWLSLPLPASPPAN